MIDVSGIDKGDLLAALHNNTKPLGLGRLHDLKRDITGEEVRKEMGEYLVDGRHIDYYHGRPIKIFFGDAIDPAMYDRDAGTGAFQRVVDKLREQAVAK